jgi:RNA-directed DNA polymerase
MFADHLGDNLRHLSEGLRSGDYRPQQIRRHSIPKPGSQELRPLGIPTVGDRVVQTALLMALEPIFERDFAEHSYGFRPGRGCKDALRRVDQLLKAGYTSIVDADLKSYFDTIPHDRLLALVGQKVSDGRVLSLIESFLKQGVLDGLHEWTPEEGSPQGGCISPLLSNIYLDPLDHLMAERGFEMVRYADDFVILCRSPEEAARALAVVQRWTAEAGLTLHPDKTKIVDATEAGFDFLGYRFERGRRSPRPKSLDKFKDAIRAKTKRTSGESLKEIIARLTPTLRGWFEYFKHSHPTTFPCLDSWIRMRLRSILRKRIGLKGRGRGSDHHRWPNAFFAGQGLYSLKTAHALARQSSLR